MPVESFEVLAERSLLSIANGKEVELRVAIGRPKSIGKREFHCPLFIEGVHSSPRFAAGVDGIQALQLALVMIGADLDAHCRKSGASIIWDGEPGAGFPLPF